MAQLQSGHQVQLLQGGLEFFAALIADIDLSAHEVRFETYIFNTRGEGDRVAQARDVFQDQGLLGLSVADLPANWVSDQGALCAELPLGLQS